MSITVHYLGILSETAGKSLEYINSPGSKTQILQSILKKYPDFEKLNFVVSHNGVITHGEAEIKNGDQITLIPPVPGG